MKLPANWRSRIEIVEVNRDTDDYEFVLQFIKGKTPKGCIRRIGMLDISFDKRTKRYWIQESYLTVKFRNRGLGRMLYEHALSKFGSLTTTYHQASEPAKTLWRKLVAAHRHEMDFFAGRVTIFK